MGGIRRQRKKIVTPGHPYDKSRIDQELPLVGEYGLRNKKELWKAKTVLSKARQQARSLLALPVEVREQREKELLSRLANLGVLPRGSDLDSVLALDVRTVLNRRLQTLVFRRGLASSPYQARQFIAHRHIAIERAIVTSPGRLIKVNEEENIDYAPRSPLVDKSHPARPQAPPTKEELSPEKKEAQKARKKPKALPKELEEELEEEEEELEMDEDSLEEEIEEKKPIPKKEAPIPKKEAPIPKKEAPIPKKEAPIPKKEAPIPKKEAPVQPKVESKPKAEPTEEKPAPKKEIPPAPAKPKIVKVDLSEIKGVGAKTAMLLKESGFDSVEKIASTKVEELTKVPGIGDTTAEQMIDEAKSLLATAKEESK